jgi:radical SAM superfamily enzyme YgiQ (UPF0313 family)
MKVAFIKPPIGGILGLEMLTFVEPLGPICVAACLEADGHECKVFDPDVVGLQCNFTTERNRTIRLAQRIKRDMPKAFVVAGGHDASRDPDYFGHEAIDAIAVGDGEEVMPQILKTMTRGVYTAESRVSLDSYPLPARHLIKHYADHYYINFRKPLALMETARGCPFKCNFCSVWKFHESTFREKSPERVVAELRTIEAPNIFITDDIFWMNVKRGEEMAKQIKAAGIKKYFTVQTRTDIIVKFPHLVEMWKDCGSLAIFLGLESVTDEGLAAVNKKNKACNNVQAIEILKELGVGFTPNFIVDPAWDHEDFTRLRDWIEQMGAYNAGFSILTPLPGTDLWDSAKQNVTTREWEMYDIVHTVLPTKLPLRDFYEEYSRLWQHSLDVRYKNRGKLRTYVALGAAVATGKVSLKNVKRGLGMAKTFSKARTFLSAHE